MEERVATSAEAANEAPTARKKPRQIPSNSSANDATLPAISENPSGTGIRGSMHGDIFQLKLLMLFLVRGITSKYKFQLSTEMPGQGGKFDDLVFHYQDTPQGEYRYRYVQAKHKQGEDNRITASDLLNETNGDYSLQKYFRSYRNEIANPGQNVQDCIICTNIGFDDNVLGSKDFNLTLINSDDTLLGIKQYPNFDKVPARYQLNITRLDESKIFELLHESSEIHQLAKKLLEYANPKNKKKITNNVAIFKMYQVALVEERVIDRETWKFHQEFITNSDLLPKTATKFRDVIFKFWNKDKKGDRPAHEFNDYLQGLQFDCSKDFGISKEKSDKTLDDVVTDEQIEDFLNKLVFAVDMPNEVRLGNILTEEVGQHFNLRGFDFQSSFMLEKMLDWLKKRQGTVMVTLDGNNLFEQTRQKMVALRATVFSIDFRSKYLPSDFLNSFQYQEETIAKTANALRDFLNSADSQ
ncbi:hypothetical protein DAPPUDRAFT_235608 [Daphnia pulex]|uniref:Uncharacterized protein n=1 Tax=Daphnia pulex TaxID=6669 RepID=E9G0B1_DAPPU|nr:hypothetical protein DAPPUDRAFT_235608 [Daphnia pulex]|eukprot:EFX86874.1 hypothetical protein DAPPUDRAFT_235608 [Daphnia pulex]